MPSVAQVAPMANPHHGGIYQFFSTQNRSSLPVVSSVVFRRPSLPDDADLQEKRMAGDKRGKKLVHETFSHIFRKAVLDELVELFEGRRPTLPSVNGICETCDVYSLVETTTPVTTTTCMAKKELPESKEEFNPVDTNDVDVNMEEGDIHEGDSWLDEVGEGESETKPTLGRPLRLALGHSHLKKQQKIKKSWFCIRCLEITYTPELHGDHWKPDPEPENQTETEAETGIETEAETGIETEIETETENKTKEVAEKVREKETEKGGGKEHSIIHPPGQTGVATIKRMDDEENTGNEKIVKSKHKRFVLRLSVEIMKEPMAKGRSEVLDSKEEAKEVVSISHVEANNIQLSELSSSSSTSEFVSASMKDPIIENEDGSLVAYSDTILLPEPTASVKDNNSSISVTSSLEAIEVIESKNDAVSSSLPSTSFNSSSHTSSAFFETNATDVQDATTKTHNVTTDFAAFCAVYPTHTIANDSFISTPSSHPLLSFILPTTPSKRSFAMFWCFTGGILVMIASALTSAAKRLKSWWVESSISSYERSVTTLLQQGLFNKASAMVETALAYVARHRGTNHTDFAAFKHLLAKANLGLCNYAHAESLLLQVVHLYEPFGEDAHMARVLEDLAESLQGQSRMEDTLHILLKAVKIFEDSYAVDMLLQDNGNSADSKIKKSSDNDSLTRSANTTTLSNVLDSAPLAKINEYKEKLVSDIKHFNSTIAPTISTPKSKSVTQGGSLNLDDFEDEFGSDMFSSSLEQDSGKTAYNFLSPLKSASSSPFKSSVGIQTWILSRDSFSNSKPCIDAIRVHLKISKLLLDSGCYEDAHGHCQLSILGVSTISENETCEVLCTKELLRKGLALQVAIDEKMNNIVAHQAQSQLPQDKAAIFTPPQLEKSFPKTSPDSVTTPLL